MTRRAGVKHAACGWRARPLAFAAVALLAGCATAGRDAATVLAFASAAQPGQTTAVLLRVEPAGAVEPAQIRNEARIVRFAGAETLSAGAIIRAPSQAAWAAGWRVLPHVGPGTYFLRLESASAPQATPLALTFRVPPSPPGVTYIGSFRVACDAPPQPCRIVPVPDDGAAAAALVAATGNEVAPPLVAPAQPYPPSFAALGLGPPAAPRIRVDPRLWVAAIDWSAVVREGGGATPATPGPRSRLEGDVNNQMVLTSSMGDAIGGALGAGAAAGPIILVGALAIVGTVALIALIAQAIAKDQQTRKDAAEARREAERLQAAAQAEAQASPCVAALAGTLAPDNVERHLQSSFAPSRPAARRAELPSPWEATVTRVVFRRCAGGPDHHGVEVATRWTATRPGEAEPAFDAAYTRTVGGAVPDARLVHSTRPPWELPVATEATCRPLADYCAPGGTDLLLQDVVRGVAEARDAIAALR
jgi:type II secretory pathway pseudopilin PulG